MKKLYLLILLTPLLNYSQIQIGQDINGLGTGDEFGYSVSLSSDGNIIAIGARRNDDNGANSGHVRVFENINNQWVQVGQSISGESSVNESGISLDLSSDGTTIIIGAHLNSDLDSFSGHARIFNNINGVWTQIGQDIDGEASGDRLGTKVAISCDGNIAAVSAINGNVNNSGYVKVYENINGVWTQIGQSINGEADGDNSGSDISLSCDGNKIAIGAFGNNGVNGPASGHVRVFENINGVWTQLGQDIDGESTGDESGSSISLSCDGNIIAIGAPENGSNGISAARGHVRIYENINGVWTQIGQDIDGENLIDNSGSSVELSCLGNILAIGALNNNPNGNGNAGHVRIYENINGVWTQIGQDIDGLDGSDTSGFSVSLSSNGEVVASGAPEFMGFPTSDPSSGYVRVFSLTNLLGFEDQIVSDFVIYPNPTKNQCAIHLDNLSNLQSVNIYSHFGQLVLSSKETTIDTSKLASGLYIVEVKTTKGKVTKKLIIE